MLYAWRAPVLRSDTAFAVVSRESGLVAQQPPPRHRHPRRLLRHHVAAPRRGRSPGARSRSARRSSTSPSPRSWWRSPAILPLFAALPWKRGSLARGMQPLWGVARPLGRPRRAGLGAADRRHRCSRPIGAALAAWLVLGAARRPRRPHPPRRGRRRRGRCAGRATCPRADWGKALAHAGLGVSIFGIAAITAWSAEDIRLVHPGDRFAVAGYELRFDGVADARGPNYGAETAHRHRLPRRPRGRHAAPGEAPLRRAADGDDRGRHRPRRRCATSTSRSATRRATAGRSAPTSSPSPTGSGPAR